jgi:hypothetical protein
MESEKVYAMVSRAGEDQLSPVRRMRVFLQELLHVPDILKSIHQVNQVQVLSICIDSMVLSSILYARHKSMSLPK